MTDDDRNLAHGGAGMRPQFNPRRWTSMRIRSKLALMLLIPVVALAGIASVRLADSAQEAVNADETAAIVQLTSTVSKLIRAMQDERSQAAVQVFKDDLKLEPEALTLHSFNVAVTSSDARLGALETARAGFDGDQQIQALLAAADKPMSRLERVRDAAKGEISRVHLTVYNAIISRLTSVIDRAVDLADTAELSRSLRAVSLLATADESSERMRVLTLQLQDGKPLDASYRPFMELSGARDRAMDEYRRISAEGTEAAIFDAGGLGSGAARPANTLESQIATSRSHEALDIDHQELMVAFDARHVATAVVIEETLVQTGDQAQAIRASVMQQVIIEVAIVIVTLVLAVLTALWLGRSVVSGLRHLRDSALRVAAIDLPTAVKQVDEHEDLEGLTPEQFADRTTPPLQTTGTDELAEVAGAFNQVHHEAIRVAAQQALLRVHIGSMFVRLARRGHSLTGRLTAELDEAERDEQDPDRLQRLFRLDHLVSLQGRANDSLLVLGGASAAKVRVSDERLGDVLKAAQGHTEHYTRVNFEMIDTGIWVKASVVDDIVQLLAELIDNATRFSENSAEITARFLTDHAVVQIRDYGIGIDPDRLASYNARLSGQAPLDLEAFQAMGLTVVGLLSARHGIGLHLRDAPDQGTIAQVTLPSSILRFVSDDSSQLGPTQIAATPEPPPVRREAPLFRSDPNPTTQVIPRVGGWTQTPATEGRIPDTAASLPIIQFEWQTVHADDSLRAGAVLPEPEPFEVDERGLPRRRPMTNLVPGAVAPTAGRAKKAVRRDPASIGATYVAYARGLSGSRTQRRPNDPPRNSP